MTETSFYNQMFQNVQCITVIFKVFFLSNKHVHVHIIIYSPTITALHPMFNTEKLW